MKHLERAALGAAVALSVLSIGDAVLRATSDTVPPWDDEGGTTWAITSTNLLMTVTFGLLAAVLVRHAASIDEGSAVRRWLRRLLAADLAVLACGYVLVSVLDSGIAGAVAGVAFLVMFVLGALLGGALVRRADVRLPAVLMVAPVPLIALTFALEAVAPGWGHPGYAETALYLGIALLSLAVAPSTADDAREPASARR